MSEVFTNRLANEKSPYLLQHKNNPVNWYPWCDEAFEKAKNEKKPIFLSIGYSTCHWCHVMEHESFEDNKTADLMNKSFINIKVDREERPDLDHVYMAVCQMLHGHGGWPLTIIMTPDKKPFFAGTYFPRESYGSRLGMNDLIDRVNEIWVNNYDDVHESADEIVNQLKNTINNINETELSANILKKGFYELASSFDEESGGFGTKPKFPSPHNLIFLMQQFIFTEQNDALKMAVKTLDNLQKGGIYDCVGFGFHRYSTDQTWTLPHFEKMLYDQAMLIMAYSYAYQITKDDNYKTIVYEIYEYVTRDLMHNTGAFFAAEDADSEGEEGKFYVWTIDEIREHLIGDVEFFTQVFNIGENGNFKDEATQKLNGKNILYRTKSYKLLAEHFNISESNLIEKINKLKVKLFNVRNERIRPHLDNKILTDWNGLMIAALSIAGRIMNDYKFINCASDTATFFMNEMIKEGKLYHRYCDGDIAIDGMLDDYSFLVFGLTELYQSTGNIAYAIQSKILADKMIEKFWDTKNLGFYFSSEDVSDLILRKKEIYDGAIPSGNSINMLNFIKLNRIFIDTQYLDIAKQMSNGFAASINNFPSAYSQFLTGYQLLHEKSQEIILVADQNDENLNTFLEIANRNYNPSRLIIIKYLNSSIPIELKYLENYNQIEGKCTAYVCSNFVCNQPITDIIEFEKLILTK